MPGSSITIEGIDQTIEALGYRPGSAKQKAITAIREYYSSDESINEINRIDTDILIQSIWDTGSNLSRIKSKRRNFSSLRSSINSDLKKLLKKNQNPENIILSEDNTFDLTQEAKDNLLGSFADAFKKGEVDLDQAATLLETMTEFLDDFKSKEEESDSQAFTEKIKTLLDKMSQTILSGGGDGEAAGKTIEGGDGQQDSTLGTAGPDSENIGMETDTGLKGDGSEEIFKTEGALEEIDDLAEGEEFEEVEEEDEFEETDDLEEEEIIEDLDDIDDDEDIEEIELDEDEEIEEADDLIEDDVEEFDETGDDTDVEEVESDEDTEFEEDEILDEDTLDAELDEDEALETVELDDDEEIEEVELDEDDTLEEIDEIDEEDEFEEIEEPVEDKALEEVVDINDDQDIEEIELDEDEELEEVDDLIEDDVEEFDETGDDTDVEEVESDEDTEFEEDEILDEDTLDAELDEDEALETVELDDDEDIEEVELDEDDTLEEIDEIDEEDEYEEIEEPVEDEVLEEGNEINDDEDIEEIELDEDEELEEVDDLMADDVEEHDEIDDDDDIEEIELDEDEELEEIDELDEDELKALEEFREKRELAEQFDRILSEKERKYNKYGKVPQGLYTVGTLKSLKSTLELQQFDMPEVYIALYPVTNSLFEIFIEETGYVTTAEKKGFGRVYTSRYKKSNGSLDWNRNAGAEDVKGACWYQPSGIGSSLHGKKNHPVVQVSVDDAVTFSSWIGRRLPTETEWEAAARTDLGYKYPWGNSFDPGAVNVEHSGFSDTCPVDEFEGFANGFDIVDMLGNVMEWTADMEIPAFKSSQNVKYCIAKGGAWNASKETTISSRALFRPGFTSNTIGFRCISEILL